jgi:hypothetical protein
MIGHVQRWWVPVLAAVAVLGVVGAGVWLATGSDETGGGFAGGGSDTGAGAPPYSGTEPDEPGSEPGDPGAEVPPPDDGGDGGAGPDVIALDSYYRYDDRHLALNYYNGIPECYGKAGEPRVEEDGERVVVTVPRTPPTGGKDTACIDIAVAGSVKVALEKPLGDRPVVDGGTGRRLDEAASPNDEEQAY